jgi:dihydrofolate reductase
MVISAVVAASQNGVIGKGGGLPWHLPGELARFKEITIGHPIIMGRKTHESIGRALPGRKNIIITRDKSYKAEGCTVVSSLDEALKASEEADNVFVIGGASIYELAMPRLDKIYLTEVKADISGDKYFYFDKSGWKMIDSEPHPADENNKYAYDIQQWVRK